MSLAYKLKGATIQVADKAFDADGKHFAAGSLLITNAGDDHRQRLLHDLSLDASRLAAAPSVPLHAVTAPRIAFMHTWLGNPDRRLVALRLRHAAGVPYDYISTQTVAAKEDDLRSKYDVIVFAPVGRASALRNYQRHFPCGTTPCRGRRSELTPNLGAHRQHRRHPPRPRLRRPRSSEEHSSSRAACSSPAKIPLSSPSIPDSPPASASRPHGDARVVGTVLNTVFVNHDSPVAYGYGASVPVISASGMAFNISNTINRASAAASSWTPIQKGPPAAAASTTATNLKAAKLSKPSHSSSSSPGRPSRSTRNRPATTRASSPRNTGPTSSCASLMPRPCCSPACSTKPSSIAEHAIVVDAHLGQGNVLLFGNNPIYRGETIGNYALGLQRHP